MDPFVNPFSSGDIEEKEVFADETSEMFFLSSRFVFSWMKFIIISEEMLQ